MKRTLCLILLLSLVAVLPGLAEGGTVRYQLGAAVLDLPAEWGLQLKQGKNGPMLAGGGIQITETAVASRVIVEALEGAPEFLRKQQIQSYAAQQFGATDTFDAANGAFGSLFEYEGVPCAHIVSGSVAVLCAVPGGGDPQAVFDAVALGLNSDQAAVDAANTETLDGFAVRRPEGWLRMGIPGQSLQFVGGAGCDISFSVQTVPLTDSEEIARQLMEKVPSGERYDTASGLPCVGYADGGNYTLMVINGNHVGIIVVTNGTAEQRRECARTLADNLIPAN